MDTKLHETPPAVVILGGSGFVGGHLVTALLDRGCRVAIVSRTPQGQHPIQAGVQSLEVRGDSQLVVNQVNGAWFIKAKELIPLCDTAMKLKAQIPQVKLLWVPRTENTEADALSKKALGVIDADNIDRAVWMKISEIAKPFGLSAVALGKKMTKAKLRGEKGKPTALAIEKGVVLRVPNGFGHDDYWHRQLLPAALREALFLD